MNHRDGNVLSQEEVVAKLEKTTEPKITPAIRDSLIAKTQFVYPEGTTLTICILTLQNGFTVTGESACADPKNYDKEIGDSIAKRNASDKIWSLAGYELKTKLDLIDKAGVPQGRILSLGSVATYVGTKVVRAVGMTRQEYNNLRGWTLPEDEDGNDPGYLVEYVDGGAPNVEGFAGYISWSPRDVFERAYSINKVNKVLTYVDRMKLEVDDLQTRLTKLTNFLETDTYKTLDEDDQRDMLNEADALSLYLSSLVRRYERIANAK